MIGTLEILSRSRGKHTAPKTLLTNTSLFRTGGHRSVKAECLLSRHCSSSPRASVSPAVPLGRQQSLPRWGVRLSPGCLSDPMRVCIEILV